MFLQFSCLTISGCLGWTWIVLGIFTTLYELTKSIRVWLNYFYSMLSFARSLGIPIFSFVVATIARYSWIYIVVRFHEICNVDKSSIFFYLLSNYQVTHQVTIRLDLLGKQNLIFFYLRHVLSFKLNTIINDQILHIWEII
jgi:hypothetical protein